MSVTHVARLARGSQEFESNREEIKNKNSEECVAHTAHHAGATPAVVLPIAPHRAPRHPA